MIIRTTVTLVMLLVIGHIKGVEDQEFLLTFQPFVGDPELDPICPAEEDIFPCSCYIIDDHLMNLDCSELLYESQLIRAFSSYFPEATFHKLHLDGNKNIKVLRERVLDKVSFSEIIFRDGTLQEVARASFASSYNKATKLAFVSNRISSFPFEDLVQFSSLTDLYLTDNQIKSFPSLTSESLKVLSLAHNPLGVLPSSAFLGLPALVSIDLDHTGIAVVNPGTFSHLSSLAYLFLGSNQLTRLRDDDLAFMSVNMSVISLSHNYINYISPMAITGVGDGVTLFLDNNRLQHIHQDIWETLFVSSVQLVLTDNPILCDCAIHWIIKNETFRSLIKFTTCSDGSETLDLKLDFYMNC